MRHHARKQLELQQQPCNRMAYESGRKYAQYVYVNGKDHNIAAFFVYVQHWETRLWLARNCAEFQRGFYSFVHSLELRQERTRNA